MYPFERFTERAKKVLTLAQQEAESAGQSYIGPEHLLLALLREGEGLACVALKALGVELDNTREAIHAALGTTPKTVAFQIIPTTRVKKVIETAFEEAQRTGHGLVGTEHLLLGLLIEGESVAAKVLLALGVTLEKAGAEIDRLLKAGAQEPALVHGRATWVANTGRQLPMLPELQQLLHRAQTLAAVSGSSAFGLDHLLEMMVSSPAGIEVLARLLDLRRIAAMKEQAIAAQDFDTAAKLRSDEQRAREALKQALTAWREELEPPAGARASSS